MYYKEYLRARKPLLVYTFVWASLFVLTSLITLLVPMTGHDDASKGGGPVPLAWPKLLEVAGFIASIIATVLGSVLATENNGHLELALTKSYSRDAYATTVIAVDIAAILVAELVAFAFILLHILIFHHATNQLVAGPDPFFNALRFILFPLAWYAIIVGLSAGSRGAAVIQGLIWPLAIGLLAMRAIPASGAWQIWHDVFVAINAFNPLTYLSHGAHASDSGVVGAMVLAALVIAGYVSAILQWRRVEA